MKKYNLYNNGILINNTPYTLEEAQNKQGLIIITYGYKPTIEKVMENLTTIKPLETLSFFLNFELGEKAFKVIDGNRLINIENRFEGNDMDITIEDDKYRFSITGETQYFDGDFPYTFMKYVREHYETMSKN